MRTEYWEARKQERLEAAEDQGAPGASDPTSTYPTPEEVAERGDADRRAKRPATGGGENGAEDTAAEVGTASGRSP